MKDQEKSEYYETNDTPDKIPRHDSNKRIFTVEETACVLSQLFYKPFGGQRRGRFITSKLTLCALTGRAMVDDIFIEKLKREMIELGFVVTNHQCDISVMAESMTRRFRRVTGRILLEIDPVGVANWEAQQKQIEDGLRG